jgi:hypothetical protein
MFWAFRLSFDVDILENFGYFFPKIKPNFIELSGHTGLGLPVACIVDGRSR